MRITRKSATSLSRYREGEIHIHGDIQHPFYLPYQLVVPFRRPVIERYIRYCTISAVKQPWGEEKIKMLRGYEFYILYSWFTPAYLLFSPRFLGLGT